MLDKELLEAAVDRYQKLGLYRRDAAGHDLIFKPQLLGAGDLLYHGVSVGDRKFGYTKETLADLHQRAIALGADEEQVGEGSSFEDRILTVTASDDGVNRFGDRDLVDGKIGKKKFGEGWLLENYEKNPVIMAFHEYRDIPLGKALRTFKDKGGQPRRKRLRQDILFDDGENNPFAPLMLQNYKSGNMRAWSVGFMPHKIVIPQSEDERAELGLGPNGWLFATNELWENSAVSIPANPNALTDMVSAEQFAAMEAEIQREYAAFAALIDEINDLDSELAYQMRDGLKKNFSQFKFSKAAMTSDANREQNKADSISILDILKDIEAELEELPEVDQGAAHHLAELDAEGRGVVDEDDYDDAVEEYLQLGVVPTNISNEIAEDGRRWRKPRLADFTEKTWEELSSSEKRNIARYYAWADASPPSAFGQLKLPHHDPKDSKIVPRGLSAAASRINQADIPEGEVGRVKRHLRADFRRADMPVPDVLKEEAGEPVTLTPVLESFPDDAQVERFEEVSTKLESLVKAADVTATRLEGIVTQLERRSSSPATDNGDLYEDVLNVGQQLLDHMAESNSPS